MEKFVSVTTQECPCEYGNVLGGCSQCAQSVALGCVPSFQFMNFVRNGVIEEAIHIPADKVDWCKTSELFSICLPKGTVDCSAGMVVSFTFAQHFTEFNRGYARLNLSEGRGS